jgi:4-aminobutyrate aminotransferase-like enzyme
MTYEHVADRYSAEQIAAALGKSETELTDTKKALAAAQVRLQELEHKPELTPAEAEEQIRAIPQYATGEGGRTVPNPEYKQKYVEIMRKAGVQVIRDRRGRW